MLFTAFEQTNMKHMKFVGGDKRKWSSLFDDRLVE